MKKLFLFLLLLQFAKTYAHQDVTTNMTGRWRTAQAIYSGDLQFISPGKFAYSTINGILIRYEEYTTSEVIGSVIHLKITGDINRTSNQRYEDLYLKFLNDSVLIYSFKKIPPVVDTTKRKVYVFRKVMVSKPGTELRLPNHKDLIGTWIFPIKGRIIGKRIVFVDEVHAEFHEGKNNEDVTYSVDFFKQPITMDFYHPLTGKTDQTFIEFKLADLFRLEWFPRNNRGDHFTFLGKNNMYVRENTYNSQLKK